MTPVTPELKPRSQERAEKGRDEEEGDESEEDEQDNEEKIEEDSKMINPTPTDTTAVTKTRAQIRFAGVDEEEQYDDEEEMNMLDEDELDSAAQMKTRRKSSVFDTVKNVTSGLRFVHRNIFYIMVVFYHQISGVYTNNFAGYTVSNEIPRGCFILHF